ncbi:MAG: TIGR03016 family PEP-CTERM system-associated outer membrane protein, partial [Pedobacter sp.]
MRSNYKFPGEQALLISQANIIRLSFCAAAMCALLLVSARSQGADLNIKPSIALSEEVTDNIRETPGNKRTEYITHISPGFTSIYMGPYWNWDATYTFNYLNYARKSNANGYTHLASLKGNISVVENFLYLDVSDTYQRVSTDVARDAATQSSSFLNQTDQNIATVSPYLFWRLGEKSTLKTGYRYTDTRYWGVGIEKQEHSAFADFSRELTSRLSLSAGYSFTLSESLVEQYNTHNVYGGFNYQYADKSSIHATIGNNWQKFSSGKNTTFYSWNIGIVHDFDIVVATLETSSQ